MGARLTALRRTFGHLIWADPWRRVEAAVAAFVALILAGVIGYMSIEGWSFLDALYMTVISITTVGFGEVRSLSDAGRYFTIVIVLFGVIATFFVFTIVVQSVVEGGLAKAFGVRRMKSRIEALTDHYVLCGFGRVGEEVSKELARRNIPFVVIESNDEAIDRALAKELVVITGDATQDGVLEAAGIIRAKGLLAASDSDADNTYITLTAKALRPDLFVVARAGKPASEARVRRAGADRVISPYMLAGRRMALSALQPLTLDFFDVLASARGEQLLAELVVADESRVAGETVGSAIGRCSATTLLAVQHPDGDVLVGPPRDYALRSGDRLMLLSNEQDMEELGRLREEATRTPAS